MIFMENSALSYDDICLVPRYSNLNSRMDAKINVGIMRNPIINSPMIHTSSQDMIRYFVDNNMVCTVHRYFKTPHDQYQHVIESVQLEYDKVFFAVGSDKEWINVLIDKYCITNFLVDMAHGDSTHCIDTIKYIRNISSESTIIAGNVATGEGYCRLINGGADIVRVGIAGGSICSTAKATAFGVPMVTSLLECNKMKEIVGGLIMADGGIRSSSDMLKAIACGADYTMIGKMIASTSLAKGPFYKNTDYGLLELTMEDDGFDDEPDKVEYYGMASEEARSYNNTHSSSNVAIEGESGLIKYTGFTSNVINKIEHNLQSGMSYNGSTNWNHFRENVTIMRMSTAGQIEKLTHIY